ncbi:hypothetical protein DENIS_3324 [Desulfonema ishimotonii]|uniref:HPt domain-containing protein n=1 Tax=Desulfonema ishimotonii TaxID=45657 RepID=A0A401FZD2_9BACT|nr:Hpt domain-containing protein [Desulfonema ishimotonii]GBC62352.1 hypothetical protein DENIS_3324 [Desulfonema ishimotonii]
MSDKKKQKNGLHRVSPEFQPSPVDMAELRAITRGEPRLIREIIRLYLERLPELMAQIEQSLNAGDSESLKFSAHALKGMSLNLAAGTVADAALQLEKTARSRDLSAADEQHARLKSAVAHLKIALDDLTGQMASGIENH